MSDELDFKRVLQAEITAKRKKVAEKPTTGTGKYARQDEPEQTVSSGEIELDIDQNSARIPAPIISKTSPLINNTSMDPEGSKPIEQQSQQPQYRSDTSNIGQFRKSPGKFESETVQVSAMDTERINSGNDLFEISPLILTFLKRLLSEQEIALQGRSEEEKSTKDGKLASSMFVQSSENLRHLFRFLRKDKLPIEVLQRLAEICSFMQQREYVRANDAYLKLAIGNAPWPIGVTAVGIHERSAQEKIKSNQIARTMDDGY